MTFKKFKEYLICIKCREKYYLFWVISLLILILNLLIGLYKPFWLDEVASLNLLNVNSASKLVQNIYNGIDTNPPLYFLSIYYLRNIINNDIIIKLYSFALCFGGIIVLFKILKDYVKRDTLMITLLIICVSSFFAQYLIVEVRSYSLFFFLTTLFLYQFHKIIISKSNDIISYLEITLISTALLYTHYFWLFYCGIAILYSFFLFERKIKLRLVTSLIFSLLFFSPWITAIQNQFNITNRTFWQEVPNFIEILTLPNVYFGRFLFVFIIIVLSFSIIKKQFLCKKEIIKNKSFFILILLFLALPMLNYILVLFRISVSEPRYYIPTYVSFIIIMAIIIDSLNLFKLKSLALSVLLIIPLYGIINIKRYYNLENQKQEEITDLLNLNRLEIPIACESPHKFYPLNYYAQKVGKSNFYFILDLNSAYLKGNVKNARFDYYGNQSLKRMYDIPNIIDIQKFIKKFKVFYIIDEKNRLIFENRFRNNSNYNIYSKAYNIYLIERVPK